MFKNMEKESTTKVVEALSEARVGVSGWEAHGNAWSVALGAVIGAGTVLILVVIVLMWRKPRRSELPLLAPMDVAHSVSLFAHFLSYLERLLIYLIVSFIICSKSLS